MLQLLGDLLVRSIPIYIPAILILSFLINHGFLSIGGNSGKTKDKPPDKDSNKDET